MHSTILQYLSGTTALVLLRIDKKCAISFCAKFQVTVAFMLSSFQSSTFSGHLCLALDIWMRIIYVIWASRDFTWFTWVLLKWSSEVCSLEKKVGVYKLGPMPNFFKRGCTGINSHSMNCVHLKSTIWWVLTEAQWNHQPSQDTEQVCQSCKHFLLHLCSLCFPLSPCFIFFTLILNTRNAEIHEVLQYVICRIWFLSPLVMGLISIRVVYVNTVTREI